MYFSKVASDTSYINKESDKSRLVYLYPLHGSESDSARESMYLALYRFSGVLWNVSKVSSPFFMFLYLYGGGLGRLQG